MIAAKMREEMSILHRSFVDKSSRKSYIKTINNLRNLISSLMFNAITMPYMILRKSNKNTAPMFLSKLSPYHSWYIQVPRWSSLWLVEGTPNVNFCLRINNRSEFLYSILYVCICCMYTHSKY